MHYTNLKKTKEEVARYGFKGTLKASEAALVIEDFFGDEYYIIFLIREKSLGIGWIFDPSSGLYCKEKYSKDRENFQKIMGEITLKQLERDRAAWVRIIRRLSFCS